MLFCLIQLFAKCAFCFYFCVGNFVNVIIFFDCECKKCDHVVIATSIVYQRKVAAPIVYGGFSFCGFQRGRPWLCKDKGWG